AIAQLLGSSLPMASAYEAQEFRRGQMVRILQHHAFFEYVTLPDNVVDRNRCLVIGAAIAWDRYDLALLADVEDSGDRTGWPPIFVFDADTCSDMDDVAAWLGDVSGVVQTPFAVLWEAGRVKERHAGYRARQFVRELLRL